MKSLFQGLKVGHQKEQQAKQWLKKQGFKIIAENYHCKGGEIDLIGLRGESLTFFEVKFRQSYNYGHPAEMVTSQKQKHIVHCAKTFLLKNPKHQDRAMQFDVLTFSANQTEPDWIQNAFQAF